MPNPLRISTGGSISHSLTHYHVTPDDTGDVHVSLHDCTAVNGWVSVVVVVVSKYSLSGVEWNVSCMEG